MSPDRWALLLSAFCFLGAFALGLAELARGAYKKTWWHHVLMGAGLFLQCLGLYHRGQELGRCPITSAWEVVAFVSWGISLLYWVIGPTFRLSLLGVFTSPLLWLMQITALILQGQYTPKATDSIFSATRPHPMVEWHATVSLLAYASYALAAIAGVMFLVQERQVKRHTFGSFFYHLPPLGNLHRCILRLIVTGCLLLSVGIGTAYFLPKSPGAVKLGLSWAVWGVYIALLTYQLTRGWPHRRFAWIVVGIFILPLTTLGIVSGR